jgi:hypothetical protein
MPEGVAVVSKDQWETGNQMGVLKEEYIETLEWLSEELRQRHAAGLAGPPRDEVLRLGLELSRLDLLREHEPFDEAMRNRAPLVCRGPAEEAALQLIVLYVGEECLSLKEWAEGAKLTRADLARAVGLAERRLFRVTLD